MEGRCSTMGERAGSGLLLTSSAHMKQDIFTVSKRIYTLAMVSTLLLHRRPSECPLLLVRRVFVSSDFDSGALQVFVMGWGSCSLPAVIVHLFCSLSLARSVSEQNSVSLLYFTYKTTHAACGAVLGAGSTVETL